MIIKLTNEQMGAALDVMTAAREKGTLGFAIMCNTRALKTAAQEYLEQREKLFTKYGTINGTTATVPRENVQAFLDEIKDISKIEREVDVAKVDVDTFTGGTLTNPEMEALWWMVKE